jgi:hypothetical protein
VTASRDTAHGTRAVARPCAHRWLFACCSMKACRLFHPCSQSQPRCWLSDWPLVQHVQLAPRSPRDGATHRENIGYKMGPPRRPTTDAMIARLAKVGSGLSEFGSMLLGPARQAGLRQHGFQSVTTKLGSDKLQLLDVWNQTKRAPNVSPGLPRCRARRCGTNCSLSVALVASCCSREMLLWCVC